MKRIREVRDPTPGLGDYRDSVGQGSWDEFGSHRAGGSLQELREALVRNQHGLCAYCEKGVAAERAGSQIEHVIPRSDPTHGRAKELDTTNLVACCDGGEKARTGSARRRGRSRLSCGQAKENRSNGDLVDPPNPARVTRIGFGGLCRSDQRRTRTRASRPGGLMTESPEP